MFSVRYTGDTASLIKVVLFNCINAVNPLSSNCKVPRASEGVLPYILMPVPEMRAMSDETEKGRIVHQA